MEVLVEIGDSRKAIAPFSSEAILDLLRKEDANGYLVLDDVEKDEDGSAYILQRWSDKWQTYVDVSHLGEIENGDKLKVLAKSRVKPTIQVDDRADI